MEKCHVTSSLKFNWIKYLLSFMFFLALVILSDVQQREWKMEFKALNLVWQRRHGSLLRRSESFPQHLSNFSCIISHHLKPVNLKQNAPHFFEIILIFHFSTLILAINFKYTVVRIIILMIAGMLQMLSRCQGEQQNVEDAILKL